MSVVDDAELALDLARKATDILLALVPHERARELLDEAAIRRSNLVADAAEIAKFGAGP